MFSAQDAKEIFESLSLEGDLSNPLIPAKSGNGFVTRKYTRQAFESLVTHAIDLDVSEETVRHLAEECDGTLLLRSGDGRQIITKSQRDAIDQELEAGVIYGLVSKDEFARKHQLSYSSLDLLIDMSEIQILEVEGYLYSTSYDMTATGTIADLLRDHIQDLEILVLKSTDVPGNPPTWFIHRTVDSLLEDPEFAGKIHVHGLPSGVRCTPVQLIKQNHDDVIDSLQSGKIAYVDLHEFQRDNPTIYATVKETKTHLENTLGIELVDAFAISDAWISNFSKECVSSMARDGDVDFGQPVIANFPDSIYHFILDKVEQAIRDLSPGTHRAGDTLLSEDSFSRHRNILLDLVRADAASQWQRRKEDSTVDDKYSLSTTFYQILEDNPVLQNLIKERALEREFDEAFSARISELEKQNELDFADFWTDRVVTRITIYLEGLATVDDEKLQDQLSELLAQYIQKDLVPDSLSKATSQGLMTSRKTRKNVHRLESVLSTGRPDVPALTSSLDKFQKKQSIDAPTASALDSSKASMLGDMARRMQKQRKSDGPLLFLTLVVFLFARHNTGIVYATGKFAPKLLRHLKPKLNTEQYAQLEAWKEAARAGTLSAEDRDGMKKMVEAGV
ncbi:hypothetical protein E8E12_009517 [Didymella heteroderae]|uniref:Uncharacterized protein n=1 Tax=Didymella heteroderae TaxID=1769908 RepID=A0A9P4WRD4_9PLEO|nr:hypothetical protein E8E12_009517 [Didymella heteroderae]